VPDHNVEARTSTWAASPAADALALTSDVDAAEAIALWARSGAMWLTGPAGGPPSPRPAALAASADSAMKALRELAGESWRGGDIDGPALLGEHAAAAGLTRNGAHSPGGGARLLATADGHLALNLARAEDIGLLPAWLEREIGDPAWTDVASTVRRRRTEELVARGRLMGLPLAAAAPAPKPKSSPDMESWFRLAAEGPSAGLRTGERRAIRVVDLSALWAGPLASHLLHCAGADVIKVEDIRRPDGARRGAASFYDLLNSHKRSVALDFSSNEDRRRLLQLIESADIVIEASRPRALRALGIDAETLVRTRPGLTWIGITGYGRCDPEAQWVAFGDDAAVAAGLATLAGSKDAPLFCADAVADPLTGIYAALAALAFHMCDGGALVDISLTGVAAHAGSFLAIPDTTVREKANGWEVATAAGDIAVSQPHLRPNDTRAAASGADTRAILEELGPC
jgi:hypothetical protein